MPLSGQSRAAKRIGVPFTSIVSPSSAPVSLPVRVCGAADVKANRAQVPNITADIKRDIKSPVARFSKWFDCSLKTGNIEGHLNR